MKAKLSIVVLLTLALTVLLVGAVIAQGMQRPLAAAPSAASAPSVVAQARVADVLHRSPVMFTQNAGRLPAAPQQPHLPEPATSPQEGSTPAPYIAPDEGGLGGEGARPDISAQLPAHPSPPQTLPFNTSSPGLAWNIQRVDAPKLFEWMGDRSLRLDQAGRPHIAYGGDHLYYAWHDGAAWRLETVDSAWGVGRYTSLALDAAGHPHISYTDWTNGDLKYARWTGSAWDIQTVDSDGVVGWSTSLALDGDGHPHISYYDGTNGDLKYARWTGSAWDIQTVDSDGDVGEYTSLALDAAGHPHISYYDEELTNRNLKYARWTGSAWAIETVDSDGDVGWYTSLALDAAGHPHISYYDDTNGDLKYAWQAYKVCLPLVLRDQ